MGLLCQQSRHSGAYRSIDRRSQRSRPRTRHAQPVQTSSMHAQPPPSRGSYRRRSGGPRTGSRRTITASERSAMGGLPRKSAVGSMQQSARDRRDRFRAALRADDVPRAVRFATVLVKRSGPSLATLKWRGVVRCHAVGLKNAGACASTRSPVFSPVNYAFFEYSYGPGPLRICHSCTNFAAKEP